MTKIVIGVDRTDECSRAADLTVRLAFAKPDFELVHVLERLEPLAFGELPPDHDLVDRLLRRQEDEGKAFLERAASVLKAKGLTVTSKMAQGFAANVLMAEAKKFGADLLAVGCEGKSELEGLLYGSVSRKLVVSAESSVMIAKSKPLPEGPIDAVLATDHADYTNRCIDKLLQMAPRGLGTITVVTAYPKSLIGAMQQSMAHFKGDIALWVEKNLQEQNEALMQKLAPLGCKLVSKVVAKSPVPAILDTLRATGAPLVILGAQGHGFLDRIAAGSVSFHLAVKEPYHTLLLRV